MRKLTVLCLVLLTLWACCLPALAEDAASGLEDGVYLAAFHTDSGMFRLNETCGGKGTLTVKDGAMSIHITLLSKNYLNAYPGPAEEAAAEGAVLIEPTEDEVTYSDGLSETVYGFDIPVPAVDEDFVIAMVGKKGKWYSHTVSVTDPEPITE